ncbi:hypothetical protein HMI56_002273 [Coelomomyces lativittatus]|nr:hypothetical protein HMI56_002273 [Coelomomyces lativittatus]
MTALDAGFWSARRLKPRIFRDTMSILMSIFYLIFADAADYKVRQYRSAPTIEMLRLSWDKKSHPLLAFLSKLKTPRITWCGKPLILPRHSSSFGYDPQDPKTQFIHLALYYSGDPKLFSRVNQLILHYPGGGFVCMSPQSHEDYLCIWASLSPNTLIVAVDYAKAPEYPYPYALEECFDLYKQIRASNGACLGLEGWYRSITVTHYHGGGEQVTETDQLPIPPIQIIVSGDSAGATLATGVVIKAIEKAIPVPESMMLIYPFLTIDQACWLPQQHSRLLRVASEKHLNAHVNLHHEKAALPNTHPTSTGQPLRPSSPTTTPTTTTTGSSPSHPTLPLRHPPEKASSESSSKRTDKSNHVSFSPTSPSSIASCTPTSTSATTSTTSFSTGIMKESGLFLTKCLRSLATWRTPPKTIFDVFGHSSLATTLAMSSRFSFFNDRILPPEILRALALLYLGPSKVPVQFETNYLVSPVLTPVTLLRQFPKVYMMCGEKDPLVDDMIMFSSRLTEAKPNLKVHDVVNVVILEGLSHAFLNMLAFLPEAYDATLLIHAWCMEVFQDLNPSSSSSSILDPTTSTSTTKATKMTTTTPSFSSSTSSTSSSPSSTTTTPSSSQLRIGSMDHTSRTSSTHSVVPKDTVEIAHVLSRRTLHMSQGLFDEHRKDS